MQKLESAISSSLNSIHGILPFLENFKPYLLSYGIFAMRRNVSSFKHGGEPLKDKGEERNWRETTVPGYVKMRVRINANEPLTWN